MFGCMVVDMCDFVAEGELCIVVGRLCLVMWLYVNFVFSLSCYVVV